MSPWTEIKKKLLQTSSVRRTVNIRGGKTVECHLKTHYKQNVFKFEGDLLHYILQREYSRQRILKKNQFNLRFM